MNKLRTRDNGFEVGERGIPLNPNLSHRGMIKVITTTFGKEDFIRRHKPVISKIRKRNLAF